MPSRIVRWGVAIGGVVLSWSAVAGAQSSTKVVRVAVDVQLNSRDGELPQSQLRSYLRRELESIRDVEVIQEEDPPNPVLHVLGVTAGNVYALSVTVDERYDRQTLRFMGITDDDTAKKFMVLKFQMGHWIFTGTDLNEIAKRLVASIDGDTFEYIRTLYKQR